MKNAAVSVKALLYRSAVTIGGDSPRLDAELLLAQVLGKTRTWLYTWPETSVAEADQERFEALVARRKRGEPIAYLLGEREFWSLPLAVSAHTLIPRPDTECLVEVALALELPDDARVLDLGTGTGAIALALASERSGWDVTGVDWLPESVALAHENARRLGRTGAHFIESDWFSALTPAHYHLIVANPPYVDPDDPLLGQGDVRFEPRTALVAAESGLADLATIAAQSPGWLTPGGWLVLEHGWRQGAVVRELMHEAGFTQVETRRDYGDRERVTLGQFSGASS